MLNSRQSKSLFLSWGKTSGGRAPPIVGDPHTLLYFGLNVQPYHRRRDLSKHARTWISTSAFQWNTQRRTTGRRGEVESLLFVG